MNEYEKEIFQMLENAGLNPVHHNMAVPYLDVSAQCGDPTELGDIDPSRYMAIPAELLHMGTILSINAKGDSMVDIGINDKDRLEVLVTEGVCGVRDGDTVVAEVDGAVTTKTFYRDEDGDYWLLPQNEKYTPIQLTDDIPWRIIGKVIAVRTDNPHSSTADILKIMKRAKKKTEEVAPPSERMVKNAIRRVADNVSYGSLWFAVYRGLVDQGALMVNDYNGFVALLKDTVPDHDHLPVASELKRMSVQSFNKPLPLWQSYDAPVQGARFDEYYRIALEVTRYLKD